MIKRARTDAEDGEGAIYEHIVPLIDARGRFTMSNNVSVMYTPALAPFASLFLDAWGMNAYTAHVFVPSMHPASVCRSDIARLRRARLLVSRKTDGVRVQLVVYFADGAQHVALVDRQFRVHAFARDKDALMHDRWIDTCRRPDETTRCELTVIDAELLAHDASCVRRPRVICHDAVCIMGVSLIETPFEARLRALHSTVTRFQARGLFPLLDVTVKPWFDSIAACVASDGERDADGLIIALATGTLRNGIATDLYKLKTHHTVDVFALRVGEDESAWSMYATDGPRPCALRDGDMNVHFDRASFDRVLVGASLDRATVVDYETLVANGVVIEAEVIVDDDRARCVLRAIKRRTDKPLANDLRVIRRTIENARENIHSTEIESNIDV